MTAREPKRCIAPIDDEGHLCGAPATEERVIEDLVCPLCAEHAAEVDEDAKSEAN